MDAGRETQRAWRPWLAWAARIVRPAVFVLSIVCFAWVLGPVVSNARELARDLEGAALLRWMILGILAYALLSVALAAAWWWLAGIYGGRPGFGAGYAVYARSQLAKYLPGNAFHYVSRQVMGAEAGLSHPALVASGFLELGSLLAAAVAIGGAGLGSGLLTARAGSAATFQISWLGAVLLGVVCLAAWPVLDRLLRRLPRTAGWLAELPHLGVGQTFRLLGLSLTLHGLFFVGTGAILLVLAMSAWGVEPSDAWRLLWLYPLAWVAGTVSIGAPAGVGVREAVLVLTLEPVVGPARAAALALALRVVTTGGDFLTAILGWWVGGRSRS